MEASALTGRSPLPDHHEEAAPPLHCQLPAARLVLPVSGLVVLPDLRQRRREAELQGHGAAGRHRAAADPERNPALVLKQDPTHRSVQTGFRAALTTFMHTPALPCLPQPFTASGILL